jgi:hypothetical protein
MLEEQLRLPCAVPLACSKPARAPHRVLETGERISSTFVTQIARIHYRN